MKRCQKEVQAISSNAVSSEVQQTSQKVKVTPWRKSSTPEQLRHRDRLSAVGDLSRYQEPLQSKCGEVKEGIICLPAIRYEMCIAVQDYQGQFEDELTYHKNDKIAIVHKQVYVPGVPRGNYETVTAARNKFWWKAIHLPTDTFGYVYKPYLTDAGRKNRPWLYEKYGRKEIEALLQQNGIPGTFCLHEADADLAGLFRGWPKLILSLLSIDAENPDSTLRPVHHYGIYRSQKGTYSLEESHIQFNSLDELVQYFSTHETLSYKLVTSLTPKPPPTFFETRFPIRIDSKLLTVIISYIDGGFGYVQAGDTEMKCTMKYYRSKNSAASVYAQIAMIRQDTCYHKNLLQLYCMSTINCITYLIMEYAALGNLQKYLDTASVINLFQLVWFSTQMACGMSFLEDKCIPHKALCTINVLLTENLTVKITNYASFHHHAPSLHDNTETESEYAKPACTYLAPEVYEYSIMTMKSDVWAYGMILHEIFSVPSLEMQPHYNNDRTSATTAVMNRRKPSDYPLCPRDIYEQMVKCCNAVPHKRPSFRKLYKFFDNYNVVCNVAKK